jgi:hypothetical protein
MRRETVIYRSIVVCLMACVFFGCADSGTQGEGPADAGSEGTALDADAGEAETSDPCDDCPEGSWCEDGECIPERGDGHYDCGGGAYCNGSEIVVNPVGDAPDAVDPCAPAIIPCEHGCDEMVEVDTSDPESACLPEPCSLDALGLEGTPVDFQVLELSCGDDPQTRAPGSEQPALVESVESAEGLTEVLGECTTGEVDFDAYRVAVIRGYSENAPKAPSWVIDVDGATYIELTFEPFSSGIEVLPEAYTLAVALPAGDTPLTAQECRIPYEGPEVP